jgi:hypothetical protein
MNSPHDYAIEKAIVALLQPPVGYFSDHATVAREMSIARWRVQMRAAVDAYLETVAVEGPLPESPNDGLGELSAAQTLTETQVG